MNLVSSVVVCSRKPAMDFSLTLKNLLPKKTSANEVDLHRVDYTKLDDEYSNGTDKYGLNKLTCQTL